jgi:hypothetical protein
MKIYILKDSCGDFGSSDNELGYFSSLELLEKEKFRLIHAESIREKFSRAFHKISVKVQEFYGKYSFEFPPPERPSKIKRHDGGSLRSLVTARQNAINNNDEERANLYLEQYNERCARNTKDNLDYTQKLIPEYEKEYRCWDKVRKESLEKHLTEFERTVINAKFPERIYLPLYHIEIELDVMGSIETFSETFIEEIDSYKG